MRTKRSSLRGELYRIGVTLFCPTRMAEALENDIPCEVMSYLHGVVERQRRKETASKDRAGNGQGDADS